MGIVAVLAAAAVVFVFVIHDEFLKSERVATPCPDTLDTVGSANP